MGPERKTKQKKSDELISPFPGLAKAIGKVNALHSEIAVVGVQQEQAIAGLDLDIEIEKARQKADASLASLDDAARALYKAFHPNG